ncbi:MAG: A/G-specific adenine glycosylase [Anaerolineae bacterium]|nr:A/G-specific adenine glycosylase [Anaerolineae bacterium]
MTLDSATRQYLTDNREEARTRLLTWFGRHARELPWRDNPTPYQVWISEVMLQQTQVETVRSYYRRFLDRFPTVQALAAASQEDVLKLWEGLGYYSRARSLHKAAQIIVDTHQGELPADVTALRRLPGIGPYTAGAIAGIAFGIPVPAVDGNVRRVMARMLAKPTPSQVVLEDAVGLWMPEDTAGPFTEALMELGATICSPRSPKCPLCPWLALCRARELGRQEAYPAPKARKAIPHYDVAAAVTLRNSPNNAGTEVLVAQRRQDDMLGGLWEFPGGKREAEESLPEALHRELREEMGIEIEIGESLTTVKHAYTHFRITLYAFICTLRKGTPRCIECQDFRWASLAEVQALPMAVTDRKIAGALEAWLEPPPRP